MGARSDSDEPGEARTVTPPAARFLRTFRAARQRREVPALPWRAGFGLLWPQYGGSHEVQETPPACARSAAKSVGCPPEPKFRREGGPTLRDSGWQAMLGYHYVYRLRSSRDSGRVYVGMTDDLHARLKKHNEGGVPSTAPCRPWMIEVLHAFSS